MASGGTNHRAVSLMSACPTCLGRCRLTTTGVPMGVEDITDDLRLAQERWYKARREGKYFRAEWWAQLRDVALDHLVSAGALGNQPAQEGNQEGKGK